MEFKENYTNPTEDLNIETMIDMTFRKKIPWTTLAIMLNELTPTLETSKQVIKVLLYTLESLSKREKPEVQTNESESRIDLEVQEIEHDDFENFANLSMQMPLTVQNQEENHQCEVCGEGFSKIGYLKKHEKKHTFRITFMCKTCGKCFNTS